MELLRSGAIHIADKKERHTFKRRPKVTDAPADSGHSDESPRSSDTTLYVGYHKVTEGFIQKLLQPVGHIVRIKIAGSQDDSLSVEADKKLQVKTSRRQNFDISDQTPSESTPQIDELVDSHRGIDPAFSVKRLPFPDSDSHTLTTSSDRSSLYLCVRPSDQTAVEVQKDNAYPLTPERPFNACRRPTVTQVASPGYVYALRRQSDLCFGWCHTRKTPLYKLDDAACDDEVMY
ncbi:hypothetical protein CLF_100367 [Clonorchis sinensis]|uniref:Uncharacterized protein n=1 Tax=Clonorchis sinensis TaxID=79923 RepID=G7Y3A5_CLOSI|nr:hypothetical protein CLF_100367 [Clonorchis sinensis]